MGTTSQLDPFEINLSDGQLVRSGDRLEGGGGFIDADLAIPGIEPFSAECVKEGEVAVFNARSTIMVTAGDL